MVKKYLPPMRQIANDILGDRLFLRKRLLKKCSVVQKTENNRPTFPFTNSGYWLNNPHKIGISSSSPSQQMCLICLSATTLRLSVLENNFRNIWRTAPQKNYHKPSRGVTFRQNKKYGMQTYLMADQKDLLTYTQGTVSIQFWIAAAYYII